MSRAPSCKKCKQPMVEGHFKSSTWFCDNEECEACDQPVYLPGSDEEEIE